MREVPLRRLIPAAVVLTLLAGCGTTTLSGATAEADAKAAAIIADCDAQLRAGKLPSYRQAVECARPRVLTTYAQAAYPYMDLVLFDLQERDIGAERIDLGTVDPTAVQRDIAELDRRLMTERERRIAARSGIGGAVPATRPEQLLAGLDSLSSIPAGKDTECFSVGSFTRCNNQPGPNRPGSGR
jgi:hypothetical protein